MRRLALPGAIAAATIAGFVVVSLQLSGGALHEASHPNWPLLATAFVVVALAQPLRAMAWRATLRGGVDFKAIYAASAVGSFLDTVLPARLGEASKVGVLRVSAGRQLAGTSARHRQPCLRTPAGGTRVPRRRCCRGRVPALPGLGPLDDGRRVRARRGSDRPRRVPPPQARASASRAYRRVPCRCRCAAARPCARGRHPPRDVGRALARHRAAAARTRSRGRTRRCARLHDRDGPREHGADPARERRRLPGRGARSARTRGRSRLESCCRRSRGTRCLRAPSRPRLRSRASHSTAAASRWSRARRSAVSMAVCVSA